MTLAFYDTECYPNYWLLKMQPVGGHCLSFQLIGGDAQFTEDQRVDIHALFQHYEVVSFNGNGYDIPMITGALNGYTVSQLKRLNDVIIVEGVKPWELPLPQWSPRDHVDVMEVAPGAGSLKVYGGRIHCKKLQDLPYSPDIELTTDQMRDVATYCENDIATLAALHSELKPLLDLRAELSARYGVDLRSKSDAQLAETVLRISCERAVGARIYKPEIDWSKRFQYEVPSFISYQCDALLSLLADIRTSVFCFNAAGKIAMPHNIEGRTVAIGLSTYSVGIGGLHSCEKSAIHYCGADDVMEDIDVTAFYPTLMENSGRFPPALGRTFLDKFSAIKRERVENKHKQQQLKKAGDTSSGDYIAAKTANEGGKIMINGTFGKTSSSYSVLFAPEMLIQTTLTGQLSILMLIEWLEYNGIRVVSANTDGIVVRYKKWQTEQVRTIVKAWESRTNLETESNFYRMLASRDVNTYFAVKVDGEVKRKGEYATSGLVEKKNPDVEICSDSVADFLSKGVPIEHTIRACRDFRKFIAMQKVSGGGVKLWGHVARRDAKVRDAIPVLEACGWVKTGRKWSRNGIVCGAMDAYKQCFPEPSREYLGKVVRWYYATTSPGPIVGTNGNWVGNSYGAKPCMTLPDDFPADIDYDWYINNAKSILGDIGLQVR